MAATLSKILLLVLALAGFWTLWGFPYQNGLLKILKAQTEPGALIPGPTAAPMKQDFTGIKVVDNQLTVLVSFFYTAIDGNRADVSLAFLALGGQVLPSWVLIMIEGVRNGNSSKFLLTATTLFGLGVAIVGYACVAPLWFALHLWISPTASKPREHQLIVDIPVKIALIPVSILIGFGVPSVLMCLPAPTVFSFETKQIWAGIQQGWPIWIGISHFTLTTMAGIVDSRSTTLTEADKRSKTIKYLRQAYAFAAVSSAGSHLSGLGLSLLAYAFPVLFSSTYLPQLQPSQIYVPVLPFGDFEVKELADGALPFLQWDLIVGVAATLLWGVTLRETAKTGEASLSEIIIGFVKVLMIAAVLGPCGTAAVAIWARDELVFRRASLNKEISGKDKSA